MRPRSEQAKVAPAAKPQSKAKGKPGPRHHKPLPGEVRIIGGLYKRTQLPDSDQPGLRPLLDRVRETLLN